MIHLEIDNVNCVATGASNYHQVTKALETLTPGYQYTWMYKKGMWNGRVNLMTDETFPAGLVPFVLDIIQRDNIPVTITDNRVCKQIELQPTTVPLRPYQEEIVNKALFNMFCDTWWPRGVLQVATGGGKTEMAAAMIQRTNVPTLFLVHRQDLATQALERFAKYKIQAGGLDTAASNLVTVTTIQSLMSWNMTFNKVYTNVEGEEVERSDEWMEKKRRKQRKKANNAKAVLDAIEQVFIDEAHLVAAKEENMNMFSTALALMPNAYMRWGLTATPFMRDKLHNWMLEGATGTSIAHITNRELIDMGYLSEAFVDMYVMNKNGDIPNDWPRCYEFGIMTNRERNNKVVDCFSTYAKPALILVNKLGQGTILETKLAQAGFHVPFISGSSTKAERLKAINDLKTGKLQGVIASTIWDEGIDISNIETVILAGGGKSEIKNLQRLGRGLRKAQGKANLRLVDFFDPSPRTLKKHSEIRKQLWESQGFTINILK